MRARTIALVIAILVVAAFTALNWSDFVRPTPLSFGFTVAEAPLGLLLLALMTGVLLVLVLDSAWLDTRHSSAERDFYRELKAQRELAEKAEASRFAELRQHIDQRLGNVDARLAELHERTRPQVAVV